MPSRKEYPLLTMAVMSEVVRNYETDTSQFSAAAWCPTRPYQRSLIEWDVLYGAKGMTPPVYPESPAPILKHPAVGHKSFKTVQWREKSVFTEDDLITLRRVGTYDEPAAFDMMNEQLRQLNVRLDTRLEWLRWKMLAGEVTIEYEDGPAQVVDYEVPVANIPTVTTGWDTHATATPHLDVQAWKLLFRGTGARPTILEMNQVTNNHVRNNETIIDIVKYTYGYDLVRAGSLVPQNALSEVFEGLPVRVNESGWVDDSGNFQLFVPDLSVILFGEGPESRCDFATTPNMYTGRPTPQTGKFARPIFYLDDDPIRVEVVVGMYGLPRMPHPNWHIYADVS